jgi:RNA polymerase sigma factor (sigma-70 family)
VSGQSDGTLARLAAAGDRAAFAALYDRFSGEVYGFSARLLSNPSDAADVTQDVFVRAIEKLSQLREPDRVRAWLFAIARHECFARTKRRSKTMATDPMDLAAEMASANRSTAGLAEANELTQLVWDAAKGLAPEDRAVLDLKLRRDLDGADLADALGVPHDQLHKVTGRAMERFERSVIALVLARGARKDCSVLAGLVESDTVELTPVLRKRIARHAQDCDYCERRRKMLVNPSTMVASAHEARPSATLRQQVLEASFQRSFSGTSALRSLSWRADGFPKARRGRRTLVTAAVLAGLLLASLLATGVGSGDVTNQKIETGSPTTKVFTGSTNAGSPTLPGPNSTLAITTLASTSISTSTSSSTLPRSSTASVTEPLAGGGVVSTLANPSTSLPVTPTRQTTPPSTRLVVVPSTVKLTVPPKTTKPSTAAPPTTKPPVPKRTQPPRTASTKPSATPNEATLAPAVTAAVTTAEPVPASSAVPELTVPPVIFPDAVPIEVTRSTLGATSPITTTTGTLTSPRVTTTVAVQTATTSTVLTVPTTTPVATTIQLTTTTLKCSLTQAGCGAQTTVASTTSTVFRFLPVCCLSGVNPGLLAATTTTTRVPIK